MLQSQGSPPPPITRSGRILVSPGFTIGPELTRTLFLQVMPQAEPFVINGKHHSYKIELRWQQPYIGVLFFTEEKLKFITLGPDLADEELSYESAMRERAINDRMLNEWFGKRNWHRSRRYRWGRIVSSFDPRSLQSSIILTYR